MTAAETLVPCLWFTDRAEEAANFYVSIFPRSRIEFVHRSAVDWPAGKAGDVLLVEFSIFGRSYQALNGGENPDGRFNSSVSLAVTCDDQAEVDRLWDALTADGGAPIMCGWCKDKYGLQWQIVPRAMVEILKSQNRAGVTRAMQAMLRMVKLDEATLRAAFEGTG